MKSTFETLSLRRRILAGLLATLLIAQAAPAAAPASAQRSDAETADGSRSTQDAQAPAPERARNRLLHLNNGSILRGSSRLQGESWEIRLGKKWTPIPLAMVTRVVEERGLLTEAKRRATRLKRDDHAARVEHARWLSTEGLYTECLASLDRVLRSEPDAKEALDFLAERPVRIALPAPDVDLEAFIHAAARMSPSAREMALGELKRIEDRVALRSQLSAELVALPSVRREFALLAMRRLFPGEEIEGLVRRAVLDRVPKVREAAALALRDAEDRSAAEHVISALGSSHSVLRRNAAEALGSMNYAIAVEPLIASLRAAGSRTGAPGSNIFVGRQIAYVQDFDVEVAQSESIAVPRVNVLTEGAVLDARVLGTHSSSLSMERRVLRSALTELTGARVSNSGSAWQKWWNQNGATWMREHAGRDDDS